MMPAILCNMTLGALDMFIGNAAVLLLFTYITHLHILYIVFIIWLYI